LGEKITTEVGKVVTEVNKVREEIVNCHNEIEQEMGEENLIVEVSMSDISGRLREQPSKTKHDEVVDEIELQGDNNLMEQKVKTEESMQIEGVETETSGLSGRLREEKSQSETENSFLRQNNDEILRHQGQMIKESYESKVYPERKANKRREIKFKKRMQKWLKVYRKLKERVERTTNKNRKTKVRRQLQVWLGVNCRSGVRTKVNQQIVKDRNHKFKEGMEIW
jgi:hypothetical protein